MSYRERSNYAKQKTVRSMAIAESLLDQMGVPMWLGVGKQSRVQMSLTQAMAALNDVDSLVNGADKADLLHKLFFNANTRVVTSNLLDAIALSVRKDVTRKELADLLLLTPKGADGNAVRNSFVIGGRWGWGKEKGRISGPKYLDEFLDTLEAARPALQNTVENNVKSYNLRFNAESPTLEEEVLTRLDELAADPTSMANAIRYIDDIANQIDDTGAANWMLDLSKMSAKIGANNALPFGAKVSAAAAVKTGKTTAATAKVDASASIKAVRRQEADVQQRIQEYQQAPAREADNISEEIRRVADDIEEPNARPEDVTATRAAGGIMTDIVRRTNPLMKMFSRNYGMKSVSEVIHNTVNGFRELRGGFTKELNALNKKYSGLVNGFGESKIRVVFREIQQGMESLPENAALRAELEKVSAKLFDIKGKSALNDLSNIGAIGPDTMLTYLRQVKIGESIGRDADAIMDLERIAKRATDEGIDMWTSMSREWKTMDVSDPIDFLGRWHAALILANTDGALTHGAINQFRKMDGVLSSVAKPGYVRLDEVGGALNAFIPNNTFVRADLAAEFARMAEYVKEARTIGGKFGDLLSKTIFPIQDTWKYTITLPRPGHHIRNLIGDLSLTFMAEGVRFSRKAGLDAFKVLGHGKNYRDVDLLAALRNEGIEKMPAGTDIISSGRYGNITIAEIYEAMQKRGLMPTFFVSEDVEGMSKGALKKFLDKAALRGGKTEQFLGSASEYRDHYARAQHFLQYIYKVQKPRGLDPKFKNLEDMLDAASKQVKKYHPDASMLTPFEAKYMRAIIPFYSWLRGAIPAIAISAVMRPGRAMVFPKASYNLAVGMGVDPNSLADPFPDDQLFPSFITKQATGPIAKIDNKYYTMNPGIANLDVGNDLGTDPFRSVLGMISPLLRMPIEAATGTKLDTGSKIKDASEYLDSNIPLVNYISNISGVSVTGSGPSLLTGNGLDIQKDIKDGVKEDSDKFVSFVNWMTGFGFGNASKQNLIELAQIEKRNREGEPRDAW
jgi:hypothetical protein